jgi:FkbM family methyltransferase
MTFISYSQNFEDVMLWRALKSVSNGFYIDVGAHDPVNGSVTKAFYDKGWCGVNIEPIAAPFELLQTARQRDINLPVCAGNYDGEIDIYDVQPTGLATTQSSIAEYYISTGHLVSVRHVPIKTLKTICREHVKGEIHFLKIDVEGFEKEVLAGADFSVFRPWILVVEATRPNSPQVNYSEWENLVINAGYRFVYFDGLNRFYVAEEHQNLISCFDTPPNYFDEFSLSRTCFFAREVNAELKYAELRITQLEAHIRDMFGDVSSQASVFHKLGMKIGLLGPNGIVDKTKLFLMKAVVTMLHNIVAYVRARPRLYIYCVAIARRFSIYGILRRLFNKKS